MLWASERVVFEGDEPGTYRVAAGWVRTKGNLIEEVGEGIAPEGAVHFGRRLISPAFVDPHTHLALVALRGFDPAASGGNVVEDLYYRFESRLKPEDVAAFARVGAYEALLNGVGVVWDHYFHAEALAKAISDVGLSAVIAPTIQDLAGPGVASLDAAYAETAALNSAAWEERAVFSCIGPHATDTVSAEHWARVLDLARRQGLPIHAHLAQSPEEVSRSLERHGLSPLRWLQTLGVLDGDVRALFAHAIFVTREELRLLGPNQTLIACPYAQLGFGLPARFDVWTEEGARWTLATDASASNDSVNLLKELRFAAGWSAAGASWSGAYERFLDGSGDSQSVWDERQRLRHRKGCEGVDALLHRVWGLAGALHPKFRAGVLEAGALANLVVWDMDHPSMWPGDNALHALVYSNASRAIHAMAVRGELIGEVGDFARSLIRSSAYRAAKDEARRRLEALSFR